MGEWFTFEFVVLSIFTGFGAATLARSVRQTWDAGRSSHEVFSLPEALRVGCRQLVISIFVMVFLIVFAITIDGSRYLFPLAVVALVVFVSFLLIIPFIFDGVSPTIRGSLVTGFIFLIIGISLIWMFSQAGNATIAWIFGGLTAAAGAWLLGSNLYKMIRGTE